MVYLRRDLKSHAEQPGPVRDKLSQAIARNY